MRLSQRFRRDSSGLNKPCGSGTGRCVWPAGAVELEARGRRLDEGGEGVTEDAQASASGAGLGQCHSWEQTGTREEEESGRKAQREDYGKDTDRLTLSLYGTQETDSNRQVNTGS